MIGSCEARYEEARAENHQLQLALGDALRRVDTARTRVQELVKERSQLRQRATAQQAQSAAEQGVLTHHILQLQVERTHPESALSNAL